eukprot:COSAG02_NODE_1262_length_13556_cov_11.011522_7_plen_87_part_00
MCVLFHSTPKPPRSIAPGDSFASIVVATASTQIKIDLRLLCLGSPLNLPGSLDTLVVMRLLTNVSKMLVRFVYEFRQAVSQPNEVR